MVFKLWWETISEHLGSKLLKSQCLLKYMECNALILQTTFTFYDNTFFIFGLFSHLTGLIIIYYIAGWKTKAWTFCLKSP